MKIYLKKLNRAENAVDKLINKMKDENIWTDNIDDADYVLIIGDRIEQFEFALKCFRENKKIIHLWAGEISQGTHDEVYRHAMTLMSCIQLCTNNEAKRRVKALCKSVDKIYFTVTIGNVMLDNLEIDETIVPDYEYDLVLYNAPTSLTIKEIEKELDEINNVLDKPYFWIEPNGDIGSDLMILNINTDNLPRPRFLGLLKNCERFITNSSCQYYEAPFLMDKENIISIGERNTERESKYANMAIPNASENVMKIFRSLDDRKIC